jgi:hypothetical protein
MVGDAGNINLKNIFIWNQVTRFTILQ